MDGEGPIVPLCWIKERIVARGPTGNKIDIDENLRAALLHFSSAFHRAVAEFFSYFRNRYEKLKIYFCYVQTTLYSSLYTRITVNGSLR